ncbi:MAG: hypothetical protein IIV44_06900 [Rikenellaceae bacterium]|nr:hypothetical protein [Rikenellaceae bacterium]
MKKFFTRFAAVAMTLVAAFSFVACDEKVDEVAVSDATVEVAVTAKTAQSATFAITTTKADAVAYYRTTDTKFLATGDFVFKNGKEVEPNTTVSVEMPYMEEMSDYRLIVAARAANGAYTVNYTNVHIPDFATSLSISVANLTYSGADVTVTPDEHTAKFVVGIGDGNSTVEQFLAGEIESVSATGNAPKTVTLQNLDAETDYIVYAQAFNRENTGSEVVSKKVTTLAGPGVDIQVSMENTIQAYVTYTPNDKCGGVIALAASASVYYEFAEAFGGEQALLETYYMMDMADVIKAGETKTTMWSMNGECDYEYLVAALVLDENGNVYDIVHVPFTSPSFDENAPEATVEITLGTNDANGTQLIYTMGEGTLGYYQSVYTKLDYDELVAYGASIGMTEQEYIQQYTAFYGYVLYENDDYVWADLEPDTEMVAVGCPFNKNGIEGYGEMTTLPFKTAPADEATASVREFVTKKATTKRALVRKEQLDALKK